MLKHILLLTILPLFVNACSSMQPANVQAWEKQHLAEKEMAWNPDPLETSMREHTYFSKEGSSGGGSAAGGGCGCN